MFIVQLSLPGKNSCYDIKFVLPAKPLVQYRHHQQGQQG